MANQELIIVFFGIIFLTTGSVLKCLKPEPIKSFSEKSCVSNGTRWFQIAGNVPCENCCIFRNMTQFSDGYIAITDTKIKNNVKTVHNYLAMRDKNASIYRSPNSSSVLVLLDTDCTKHAVLYDITTNDLQVYTKARNQKRSLPTTLEGVKKCGLPIYTYGAETECEKIS
nr:uncharacterized protein LOC111427033 [Onthophagus taurus]